MGVPPPAQGKPSLPLTVRIPRPEGERVILTVRGKKGGGAFWGVGAGCWSWVLVRFFGVTLLGLLLGIVLGDGPECRVGSAGNFLR